MESFNQNYTEHSMYHLHGLILNTQSKGGIFGVCFLFSLGVRTKNKAKGQKSKTQNRGKVQIKQQAYALRAAEINQYKEAFLFLTRNKITDEKKIILNNADV